MIKSVLTWEPKGKERAGEAIGRQLNIWPVRRRNCNGSERSELEPANSLFGAIRMAERAQDVEVATRNCDVHTNTRTERCGQENSRSHIFLRARVGCGDIRHQAELEKYVCVFSQRFGAAQSMRIPRSIIEEFHVKGTVGVRREVVDDPVSQLSVGDVVPKLLGSRLRRDELTRPFMCPARVFGGKTIRRPEELSGILGAKP